MNKVYCRHCYGDGRISVLSEPKMFMVDPALIKVKCGVCKGSGLVDDPEGIERENYNNIVFVAKCAQGIR